jgi:hypothetical protein
VDTLYDKFDHFTSLAMATWSPTLELEAPRPDFGDCFFGMDDLLTTVPFFLLLAAGI